MKRLLAALASVCLALVLEAQPAPPSPAPSPTPTPSPSGASKKEPPRADSSVTQHTAVIGGAPVAFTATAGTLVVRNEKDEPWANIGYVAYVRKDTAGSRRPIAFCYNGGPGSSSIWLHMGALGPRRVVVADATFTPPPPYQVVDNAYSILDKVDVVLIDPVGTGLSRPIGDFKNQDFWGVDPDIESVSRFIKQYVSDNGRWNSPKYLIGESYGTTRSAGVVDWLQSKAGMAFNGVVLISNATDLGAIFAMPGGTDDPYPLFLPSYAATAWYHKALANPPAQLEPWLTEVRQWAAGEYRSALFEGDRLSEDRRGAVIKKLSQYTGLSEEYLRLANMRVSEGKYTEELFRQKRITVGRLDSRFAGPTVDPLAKEAEADPQSDAISAAYTAAFFDWYNGALKFGADKTYAVSVDAWRTWDFKHRVPGLPFPSPALTNTGVDLAHALISNPNLRVIVLNGYFDLATPFFATEYMVSHLGLEKSLQSHIEMKYYPAGHMMYVDEGSLKAMKTDVADFVARTMK
jgi:carboxypeptidase C (cathepsin A)